MPYMQFQILQNSMCKFTYLFSELPKKFIESGIDILMRFFNFRENTEHIQNETLSFLGQNSVIKYLTMYFFTLLQNI